MNLQLIHPSQGRVSVERMHPRRCLTTRRMHPHSETGQKCIPRGSHLAPLAQPRRGSVAPLLHVICKGGVGPLMLHPALTVARRPVAILSPPLLHAIGLPKSRFYAVETSSRHLSIIIYDQSCYQAQPHRSDSQLVSPYLGQLPQFE